MSLFSYLHSHTALLGEIESLTTANVKPQQIGKQQS